MFHVRKWIRFVRRLGQNTEAPQSKQIKISPCRMIPADWWVRYLFPPAVDSRTVGHKHAKPFSPVRNRRASERFMELLTLEATAESSPRLPAASGPSCVFSGWQKRHSSRLMVQKSSPLQGGFTFQTGEDDDLQPNDWPGVFVAGV